MKKYIILILSFLFLSSCSNDLYKYYDYDNLIYAYSTGNVPEKRIKRFSRQFERIANSKKGKRELPPPGACAEYGYLLYMEEKPEKGKEYLLKEIEIYPESKTYIEKLIKSLEE